MPLKYPPDWKYEGFPHQISNEAHREFIDLIDMMIEGAERPKSIYEDFKSAFGDTSSSSDPSWAQTDMQRAISGATQNAARYVASFYSGMESAKERGIDVPSVKKLNGILTKHGVPLVIEPPHLRLRDGDIEFVPENVREEALAAAFVQGPEIGHGGFGRVYKVTRKTKLGEYHFAMKVLVPSVFIENKERANKRFIRELRTLEKLQHRGIVSLLEAGMTAEQDPYILMPLVEGLNIRDALEGAEPTKVLRIFDEILYALDFAHGRGVLHRDLKPKNILVREADEQPLILDFGCAYLLDEGDEELTTTLVGTDAYVPEDVRRDPKKRSVTQDVYACGILLYEVIARRLPNPDDYEPLENVVDGFEGLDKLIQRAIGPERKRFTSIAEMRQEFRQLGITKGTFYISDRVRGDSDLPALFNEAVARFESGKLRRKASPKDSMVENPYSNRWLERLSISRSN
jgi:serine/threonine protein kinase